MRPGEAAEAGQLPQQLGPHEDRQLHLVTDKIGTPDPQLELQITSFQKCNINLNRLETQIC